LEYSVLVTFSCSHSGNLRGTFQYIFNNFVHNIASSQPLSNLTNILSRTITVYTRISYSIL